MGHYFADFLSSTANSQGQIDRKGLKNDLEICSETFIVNSK